MTELLPCPFCKVAVREFDGDYYFIHDDDCFIGGTQWITSPQKVKMWNTRAASPSEWQVPEDEIGEDNDFTKGWEAGRKYEKSLATPTDDMLLVPIIPTDEMLEAGSNAGDFHILHYDGTDKPGTPRYSLGKSYAAMIAAAPPNNHNREGA